MKFHCPHFRTGVAFTLFIAIMAFQLEQLPGVSHLGVLPLALLLGIAMRALLHIPENQHLGIGFSAKHFLRIGMVFLGVRLNFSLIAQAGMPVFFLVLSGVTMGLLLIPWVGKFLGLSGNLPLLIAIDTSICGASAVGIAGPTIAAQDEEVAVVVPICSLMGTIGIFVLTMLHEWFHFSATTFGVIAGTTLHEVAQVMAAASMVSGALDSAVMTKMMRVLCLAPLILALRLLKNHEENKHDWSAIFYSIWFVFGFLIVGMSNTFLLHLMPHQSNIIAKVDQEFLLIATFLMAMAMAGLGLQVDFRTLRKKGLRTAGVAAISWLLLLSVVAVGIYLIKL